MNPDEKTKKRILIVDDHPISREGLRTLIRQTGDLIDCGEAEDAEQAIAMAGSLRPDLVSVDISLRGRSGIELIKDLRAMDGNLPLVVITMHDENLYAELALRAGASAYLMKNLDGERLLDGIRLILAGKKLSPNPESWPASALQKLTDREWEVLRLFGGGLSTVRIAERLGVKAKTIETHRMNIKAKLGFDTAMQLIAFASRWASAETAAGEGRR